MMQCAWQLFSWVLAATSRAARRRTATPNGLSCSEPGMSGLGFGCVETSAELRSLQTCDVSGREIDDRPELGSEYHLGAHKGLLGLL